MTVLLIGCGRMGGALARSWVGGQEVLVFDPHAAIPPGATRVEHIEAATLPEDLVVVLAVKPQMFGVALPMLRPLAERGALFLSVVAGAGLQRLGRDLGGTGRIIRSMPNTPAAIGRGITAAVAGAAVTESDRARADALLRAAGEVVWLDVEADLDLVTAVSGSGPAYFFRFAEALAAAGVAAGLSPEIAMRLARATFTGSAALADARPESLAELRVEVTSPGGTTAAGLAQLDADGAIDRLAAATVAAAAARSRALGA
ncbi:MAG: pyrroline-5-carboxylate reductase [Pseudomonadota bacterium]